MKQNFAKMYLIFALATFVAPMLTGCMAFQGGAVVPPQPPDAQVYALQIGTTIYGIRDALAGAPGSQIWMKDNMMTFMWSVKGQGVGMYLIDIKTFATANSLQELLSKAGLGNLTNYKTAEDFRNFLSTNGWKIITAEEVCRQAGIAASAAMETAATRIAQRAPIFIIMWTPVDVKDGESLDQFFFPGILDPNDPQNQL